MFIDQAKIHVKAGDGGNGCASFRHEKYVEKGGPNGGHGGHGGSIIIYADPSVETLLDFKYKRHYKAKSGAPGTSNDRHGATGEDLVIPVPVGTVISDLDTGMQLRDLDEPEIRIVVADGGKGGRGNTAFKSSTNQVPREFEEGTPGTQRSLRLELKLIADVGLAGLPNAGKSTLLGRATAAHPKVAPYPFTTLAPSLGIAELSDFRRIVIADIPGLIEGSHEGHGMGDEFLRHIERTRVIIHVVDMAPLDGSSPAHAWRVIENELASYSLDLTTRPHLIAANKMDLPDAADNLELFREELADELDADIFPISALTGEGFGPLIEHAYKIVQKRKAELEQADEA